jgi:enoyl-CoA hydratase/carnithine racemase
VTCTITDGVADVRLNRPDKLNALDLEMFDALVTAGEALKADARVRAVVLSGEGKSFCAGLDFGAFRAMAGDTGDAGDAGDGGDAGDPPGLGDLGRRDGRITTLAQQAVYVWTEMPAPVIAAVHGHALGGGCQLALGADIRVVSPDASLSIMEIRWGLIPDMTGTQMLPRLVSLDVAKDLTLTGRVVSGEEAARLGLATRLSPTPLADALALAREIADHSPPAVKGAKALLNLAGHVPLAEGFQAEARTIAGLIGTPNQIEAVMASFEKRRPRFED